MGKSLNWFKNKTLPLSKNVGVKTNSGDQKPDVLHTPVQKRFNDFLSQIKEERTNMDMNLFKEVFGFDTPDQMLQNVHNLKRTDSYNQEAFLIEDIVMDFGDLC